MEEDTNTTEEKREDQTPEGQVDGSAPELEKSQNTQPNSNQNMNAALAYLFGWITGLIFLLIEQKNEYVRFHAAQSLVTFGALTILSFVPLVGLLVSLFGLVIWVLMIVKAYQGERFKLPVVGDFAEKVKDQIGKSS